MQINYPGKKTLPPFKSVAAALLFSVILGPVGVLYGSVLGGVLMILFGFVVLSTKLVAPILLFWSFCAVICVSAVNRYNHKLIQLLERLG